MIKIMKYGQVPNSEIFARVVPAVNVEGIVADIIADVRANGDKAVLNYNLKFDKANLDTLLVSQAEIDEAFETVEPKFLSVLEQAAENIRERETTCANETGLYNHGRAANSEAGPQR